MDMAFAGLDHGMLRDRMQLLRLKGLGIEGGRFAYLRGDTIIGERNALRDLTDETFVEEGGADLAEVVLFETLENLGRDTRPATDLLVGQARLEACSAENVSYRRHRLSAPCIAIIQQSFAAGQENPLNTFRSLASTFFIVFAFITTTEARTTPPSDSAGIFRGGAALNYAKHAVSFGERPAGSPEMSRQREWILSELKLLHAQINLDNFQGQTPSGPVAMTNIIVKFPGASGKAIAVTGHYDTLRKPMVHFVGANDGGSSTGFLLEFARWVSKWKHRDDIYLVFFDGEEAVVNWTPTDSLYGSRHLAAQWLADGTLKRLKALINIDMIGDKDLDMVYDLNSSAALRARVKAIAGKLGYSGDFAGESGIDDDHKPFADLGVEVLDLIDLDYGPQNGYWHTANDTVDKLSARSFQAVGDITVALVKELDGSK